MPYKDLRHFIETLEAQGELKRIQAPVDVELEISEITDRISKQGGPALLFENPKGYSIPVLINSMGSKKRMLTALGLSSYENFFEKYFELLDKPANMMDKLKLIPRLTEIAGMMPALPAAVRSVFTGDSRAISSMALCAGLACASTRFMIVP